MSKEQKNFDEMNYDVTVDEATLLENHRLQPRLEIVAQMIAARKAMKMTQADVAEKVGTQKSNISRFESGRYNPTVDFLVKMADALDKELKITIE